MKYSDDSSDLIYNDHESLHPYQVNMYVGSIDNEGSRYRALVQGCY
ncbi:MAG: hypothetical protein AAF821_20605 [Cyanobacteria bacterium P01_D01_bin.156]